MRRAAAAESLGVWGAAEAYGALAAAVADSVPGVRERVAEALGRVRNTQGLAPLLRRVFAEEDSGVAHAAARAMATLAADSSVELLAPSLEGPSATLRLRTARALTEIARAAGPHMGPSARLRLGGSLGDVVNSAQRARHELPGNWRAWDTYREGRIAPEDSAEVLADQAAVALAWLGGARSGPGLLRAVRGTMSPAARDSVLAVVAMRNDTLIIERLARDLETNVIGARRRAIGLLGGVPHVRAQDALLRGTSDTRTETRRAAWRSLVRLSGHRLFPGDERPPNCPLRPGPAVVLAAERAAHDPDPVVAICGAFLWATADPAGVPSLAALRPPDDASAAALCRALEIVPPQAKAASLVAGLLTDAVRSSAPAVRAAAMPAISKWDIPDAVAHVRTGLADPDSSVMRAALCAAGLRRERSLIAAVMPKLDADPTTRALAAEALASLADSQSVAYLVLALTTDQIDRRRGAVQAIGSVAKRVHNTPDARAYRVELSQAIPWLKRMAAAESAPGDRAHALWALGYLPSGDSEQVLGLALGDEFESVRLAAAVGIAHLRPALSIPSLRALALRGSLSSRAVAIETLAALGSTPARNVLRAVSVLDPSPVLRRRARDSLARTGA